MAPEQNILIQPLELQKADSEPSRGVKRMSADNPSFFHKAWEYAKSRFNSDNWFGSIVTPALFFVNYRYMMASRTRIKDGISTPDRKRELSHQGQMAEVAWSFFSARGGKFPEGKTALERIGNALRHPQISSAQFGYLALLPALFINLFAHLSTGLKAHGIGLKSGETAYAAEKIRLYSGLFQALSVILIGVGHFKKRAYKPTDIIEQDSQLSNASVKKDYSMWEAVKKMWRHDRILLIGLVMNMIGPVFGAFEAWGKREKSRTEAIHLAWGTLGNCLIVCASGLYTVQRIAKGNYSGQGNNSLPASVPKDADEGITGHFKAKMLSQKTYDSGKLEPNQSESFVQRISSPSRSGLALVA